MKFQQKMLELTVIEEWGEVPAENAVPPLSPCFPGADPSPTSPLLAPLPVHSLATENCSSLLLPTSPFESSALTLPKPPEILGN